MLRLCCLDWDYYYDAAVDCDLNDDSVEGYDGDSVDVGGGYVDDFGDDDDDGVDDGAVVVVVVGDVGIDVVDDDDRSVVQGHRKTVVC